MSVREKKSNAMALRRASIVSSIATTVHITVVQIEGETPYPSTLSHWGNDFSVQRLYLEPSCQMLIWVIQISSL